MAVTAIYRLLYFCLEITFQIISSMHSSYKCVVIMEPSTFVIFYKVVITN